MKTRERVAFVLIGLGSISFVVFKKWVPSDWHIAIVLSLLGALCWASGRVHRVCEKWKIYRQRWECILCTWSGDQEPVAIAIARASYVQKEATAYGETFVAMAFSLAASFASSLMESFAVTNSWASGLLEASLLPLSTLGVVVSCIVYLIAFFRTLSAISLRRRLSFSVD